MTEHQASQATVDQPDPESEVADYLHLHADFFTRHPQLLTELRIPHSSGRAVSLIERQVEALRAETAQYRQRIAELVQVARDNESLSERLHRMTLALIDAADFTDVLNILEDHLHEQFRADAVELKLFSADKLQEHRDAAQAGNPEPGFQAFMEFFDQGRPVCGRLTERQLGYLFGAQAEDVGSAALLPLQGEELLGVLAIGSGDPERFHAQMGTQLLERLAEIVSRKLQAVSLPGV